MRGPFMGGLFRMFLIYIKPVLEKLQEEFLKFFNLVQIYHIV